jgi:hypothetical protein
MGRDGQSHGPRLALQSHHLAQDIFPKTGGGEDIDFVYQYKEWYRSMKIHATVGVPETVVQHPWGNQGGSCYHQIIGWAWGDSLCITEWSNKTFLTCPTWVEHCVFVIPAFALYTTQPLAGLRAATSVVVLKHVSQMASYFAGASKVCEGKSTLRKLLVALGAGSVLSAQEVTRTVALIRRGSLDSLCRRVDWFDGQQPRIVLDTLLTSVLHLGSHMAGLSMVPEKIIGNGVERTNKNTTPSEESPLVVSIGYILHDPTC